MEIQWTRMTGQWPVEASPLVIKSDGVEEILILNRGGQLLHWSADGKMIGSGQDGLVAQLPPGRWTTSPALLDSPSGAWPVVTSVEGLVIGLDRSFRPLWQHRLPGETIWGRALPARLNTVSGPSLVFSDRSGTVTCIGAEGTILWRKMLTNAACKAPPQTVSLGDAQESVMVSVGPILFCCETNGKVRWQRDVGSDILTRPEVLRTPGHPLVLCGTAAGVLCALNREGSVVWRCETGDTFSHSVKVLRRLGASPLILFTGLWGNLHAVDSAGRQEWTHLFRSKVRGEPFILNSEPEGGARIFLPTFHAHLYEFDERGELKDDLRLSGILPSTVAIIGGVSPGHPDLLVTSTTLLAYRVRPGGLKSPYGPTAASEGLTLSLGPTNSGSPSLLVNNPRGALISAQVSMTDQQGVATIAGQITARSAFEIPLPSLVHTGQWTCHATARAADGQLLAEKTWPSTPFNPESPAANTLRAWPTLAFGSFTDTRLTPLPEEISPETTNRVRVKSIYLDEVEQSALILASTRTNLARVRVSITNPVRRDGLVFGGAIAIRQVLPTGSVNGEQVPDALPALGDAGLVTLPPNRSAKLWLSVDAHGAEPGEYAGQILISPIEPGLTNILLPLELEILDLRLPKEFPLTLCTWDYIPNHWFPARSPEVLDDMGRHGANIFPRSTIPPARVDPGGKPAIDWALLDQDLKRLDHRGRILFHLNHPPIEFLPGASPEQKRSLELEYIRAFRDHLDSRGWNRANYAFYLLDEPGLDYGTNIPTLLDAGKLFREADPKLQTYTDPVPGLSWRDYEQIEPLVDIWAPNMRLVSGLLSGDPRIARIMKAKTVWSYECVAQVKSLSPLRYNRANAWRAKFFGLGGIGFWTHSTTQADLWSPGKTTEEEYALVYPGQLPVPSVRWEAVRDGLEDVAAITLLQAQIERHRRARTREPECNAAEETLRIAMRDVMELSDETFVESRDFLRAGDRVLWHTWTDAELFARHRAEIARLTLSLSEK